MTPDFSRRVSRLQASLAAADLTALLVTDLINVRWLTGFTGTAGLGYVGREGPVLLVTDDRYTERAQDEAPAADLLTDRTWDWLATRHPGGTPLALEADHITWAGMTALDELDDGPTLTPSTGLIQTLRQDKDDTEIAHLRAACDISSRAFEQALDWLAPGLTERQIARRLIDSMLAMGAEDSAFEPIVAAGTNGSRPHHAPTDRAARRGELVTMDFGAKVAGYHADMTRTVALGTPSEDLAAIHSLVEAAQQAGVQALQVGAGTSVPDTACRDVIAAAGHGEQFVHGTGHGVGLVIHETPFLGARTTGTLRDRMTITVEPGVYVPGIGGVRIEDVVLVADTGPVRLTTAPRQLLTL